MPGSEERNYLNEKTTQRKRKKQYAASTPKNENLKDSSSPDKSKALQSKSCCCKPCCTGNIKEDINSCFCCCAVQRIGAMFVLVEKDDGTPVFIVGPEWQCCMCCTVPTILLGSFGLIYFILMNDDFDAVSFFPLFFTTCPFISLIFSHFGFYQDTYL